MFKRTICIFLVLLSAFFALTACGRDRQNAEPYHENIVINDGLYNPLPETSTDPESPTPMIEIPPHNDYIVHLEIDTETRTVQGISRINFTNRSEQPLDTVVMRVYLNAFSEGHVPRPYFHDLEWRLERPHWERGFGYMEIQHASINNEALNYDLDGTVLTLYFEEPILPNVTVQLLLQYNAYVPRIAHRIGGNNQSMWFGMFLPVLAMHDENGWNTDIFYPAGEPFFLDVANYHVTIVTPMRYTVAGTGVRTEEVIEDTDTRITHFAAHMVRDFAFALSPSFHHAHAVTESGVHIHFYYHTETLDIDRAMHFIRFSMEYFESRVGVYPFGQVTIVETDLIGDVAAFSQVVFVDTRQFFQNMWWLARGLGDQWLGMVVGTNRVAEPWLNEGLTRFIQAGIFYPTPETLRARIEWEHNSIANRQDLFITDGLGAYASRTHYAYAQGRKAKVMLYALYRQMGHDSFWQLINQYYYEFAFGIATADDFIRIAEEHYGSSLQSFFYEWMVLGTVPELPDREM